MKKAIVLILSLITFITCVTTVAYASFEMTADEAIEWVLGHTEGEGYEYDGAVDTYIDGELWIMSCQCVDLIRGYMDHISGTHTRGNAGTYTYNDLPDGYTRIQKYDGFVPAKGDILIWSGNPGHVAICTAVNSQWEIEYSDQNGADSYKKVKHGRTMDPGNNSYWGVIRPDFKPTEIRGSEMSHGYERVIPDGDYLIAAAGTSDKTTFYYLDIEGSTQPAANESNVSLWGPSIDPPSCDIWTITYNENDGFYTIKQYGSNMCLDVDDADTLQGKNIQVYNGNESSAQKWAISRNGNNGYRIQAKCSGMCLDICDGKIDISGTNIWQYSNNDSAAQSWLFIPYQPLQPVEEGRYVLLYTSNSSYEIDVDRNTGNIQMWSDTAASQYNSFDFFKLSNGYYKIKHAASGKCLYANNGLSGYKTNVYIYEDDNTIAQQWAIVPNNTGYSLIARCNGYALDLPDGVTSNGKNVELYPRFGNNNQRWSIVQAEQRIRYYAPDAEGGIPSEQIKYYKTDLVLSTQIPIRPGYRFMYWEDILSLNENMETIHYYPGDTYSTDNGLMLYAVWKPVSFILPNNLQFIEDEAFAGIKDCIVRLPDGVTYVSPTAFDSSITLLVTAGSDAAKAVKDLGLPVIEE